MANNSRVKGITIEIGGDATGLSKALEGVNKSINNTQSQLKDVNKLLKLDPGNTELLRQKQQLLSKAVGQTTDRLESLKQAAAQLKASGVDENSEQFMALRREIIETESSLDSLTQAANSSNAALSKIADTADEIGSKAQKVADATSGLSKVAGAGLAAAGGAVVKIVDAYADSEQLIGGVETLFKDSAGEIKRAAADAYKTAGLSANEYMETVTGFSASLISSLAGDTRKAASYADMAITDMADNANKMGTDIGMLQNAYSGFARGTFVMLDNLKLGYAGSQGEMERLLADAEALSGVKYDISNFADIVDAIHVVQTEMGITGTTAKEAAETVSGSVASFKSSVSNLMAGMGDADADMEQLTGNVVESFETMAANILPVLRNIWDNLPGGAKFALGAMGVMAAISPIAGGIAKISRAVSSLTKILPTLGTAFKAAFTNPVTWIVALVALLAVKGDEIQGILQKVDNFLQGVFAKDWTEVFGPVLGEVINGFFANLKNIWGSIKQILDGIIDFIRGVFTGDWERAWQGVLGLFEGIFGMLGRVAKVPINAIISLLNGAINGINRMIDGLNSIHFDIPDWVPLLGGKSFGLNLRHLGNIPYLAKGGILSQGRAIVGEAGPELLTMSAGRAVVQPLTNNSTTNHNLGGVNVYVYGAPGQDVDELADVLMDKMQAAVDRREAAFA